MSTERVELCCATCAAPLAAQDRFCEKCGARVNGEEPVRVGCRACGAPADALGEDGYCTLCGVRAPPPTARLELDLTLAAAVSDQGRVHSRNEDAFHLEVVAGRSVAVVVCDGISSATAGDIAAQAAARAAGTVLADSIRNPSPNLTDATLAAFRAAQDAVEQVPWTAGADHVAPSCTLVSALWCDGELVVGSVGDSRAYWISASGPVQLTVDDSWAAEQVTAGLLTAEQAVHDPRFHSITNWIGADAPDRPPEVRSERLEAAGRLLVCSDGLWNYAPSAEELAALVEALPNEAAPAAVARTLTDHALARGGRDNITVAVVDIDPADPARSQS